MNKAPIKEAVLRALRSCGKPLSLPVPIKKIIREGFPNVKLVSFSKQMDRRGISYEEMKLFAGTSDACTDYYADSDVYVIYYNDIDELVMSSNRYRWNIAHELGHIVLNHHKKYNESRIFRNRLSDKTYSSVEGEADMFAAYILVPHIVISCVSDKVHIAIKQLCKVSEAASNRRLEELQIWGRRGSAERYDLDLLSFFSYYVEKNAHSNSARQWLGNHRVCRKCLSHVPLRFTKFCEVCGSALSSAYKKKGDMMHYLGIELDGNSRAIECPICQNEDISGDGDYCIICGNSLLNRCSENFSNPINSPCDNSAPLPGNARYCPYCGSKSTFLASGVLPEWNAPDLSGNFDDGELPF